MLTPLEAYKTFIERFPDAQTESIAYLGVGGYMCSRCKSGDIVDDIWAIDATTGEIKDLCNYTDYVEFMNYIDKNDTELERDEDGICIGIGYKISDLLKKKVS